MPPPPVDNGVFLRRSGGRDRCRMLERPPRQDREDEEEHENAGSPHETTHCFSAVFARFDPPDALDCRGRTRISLPGACLRSWHGLCFQMRQAIPKKAPACRPGKTPIRNKTSGRKAMANRYSRILQTVAVLVLVGFVISGKTTCSPGRQIDDASIKTAVKAKMAADVRLSTLTNIEVNSTNGVVTLSGQVENESDRAQAVRVARSVDGVVKVNNELQIKH